MRHLFIIDPLEKLNLKLDSSLRMAGALAEKGASVYCCDAYELAQTRDDDSAFGYARALHFKKGRSLDGLEISAKKEKIPLKNFDAIHMRKDPPFDLEYLTATWLLNDAAKFTKVYNDPKALRGLNEKLAIFRYPEFCAPTLVSAQEDELWEFLMQTAKGEAVLKPLHFHGGRGVKRLSLKSDGEAKCRQSLHEEFKDGITWRLMQPFNPAIHGGELRVFAAGGKTISWCRKIPQEGNFLANTAAGARIEKMLPDKKIQTRLEHIAKDLMNEGVYFIGFDVIGDLVSEINITSPRLLQAENDTTDYYGIVAAEILADLNKTS